jgi:hypothetical protein
MLIHGTPRAAQTSGNSGLGRFRLFLGDDGGTVDLCQGNHEGVCTGSSTSDINQSRMASEDGLDCTLNGTIELNEESWLTLSPREYVVILARQLLVYFLAGIEVA